MFQLHHTDTITHARAGILKTEFGEIQTPIFMPVGTRASVKAVFQHDLHAINASIILGNTYHLYLKPGMQIIHNAGGLHKFMNWNKPILTDSGGFQVFSLSDLRKITEEGVIFKSHIDGSKLFFSPENVIDTQRIIGSNIMMCLDECPPFPSDYEYLKKSSELTLRWAERSIAHYKNTSPLYGHSQFLFGITQGGTFADLRTSHTKAMVDLDFSGYAIGGLAVGESEENMYAVLDITTPILPENKPRYLMGVGTPRNILNAIERGIDMFDCVIPTREGRNGRIYTSNGIINIRQARYADDHSPIEEIITTSVSHHSKAYIRHLVQVNEILGLMVCSLQNSAFYLWLTTTAREKILDGTFLSWKQEFLQNFYAD